MKIINACSIVFIFLMLHRLSYASDKPALTYEKIEYIANNCATSSGFAAWLQSKQGISDVEEGNVYLVSLPPINYVSFRMKGKNYRVRIRPTLPVVHRLARESNKEWPGGRDINWNEFVNNEVRRLDKLLAEYNEGQTK